MRPVTITISGSYWDSQIYSGELFLFTDNGSIKVIDWREEVDILATENPKVQTALRVAFLDGDLFYNPKVRKILLDPELQNPIKEQLAELARKSLVLNKHRTASPNMMFDSPFDFLPTDTEIYYNTIYAAGDDGLFSSPSYLASRRARRHHDGPVFQVKASDRYTALAAAGGDDGLMEFRSNRNRSEKAQKDFDLRRIARQSCKACDWAFQSVMGWNHTSAFLASFREEKNPNGAGVLRIADRIFDFNELFSRTDSNLQESSVCWGAREKLYRLGEHGIDVIDYSAQEGKTHKKILTDEETFNRRKQKIETDFSLDDVVSTGTASFGTVIELVDRVLVLASNGEVMAFKGEPVHWRIFPRAEYYSNQLHILYEDRIDIISFVHDYFVDQESKLLGFFRKTTDDLSKPWKG